MLVLSVATHSSAALWVWYKLNKPVKAPAHPKGNVDPTFPVGTSEGEPQVCEVV